MTYKESFKTTINFGEVEFDYIKKKIAHKIKSFLLLLKSCLFFYICV